MFNFRSLLDMSIRQLDNQIPFYIWAIVYIEKVWRLSGKI